MARLAAVVPLAFFVLLGAPAGAAPNGNGKIAYSFGSSIVVSSSEGKSPRRVAIGVDPLWSPDGSSIAFLRERALYVIRGDGTGLRRLATEAMRHAWSPDGSLIAFVAVDRSPPTNNDIYVVRVADRTLTRVTSDGGEKSRRPSWSADGNSLVYDTQGRPGEIVFVGADGSGRRVLSIANAYAPAWSPDGARIAYLRTVPAGQARRAEVFSVSPDGSRSQRLSDELDNPSAPAWSPDGKRLLVQIFTPLGDPQFSHPAVMLVQAQDPAPSRVVSVARGGGFNAVWSPDGTKIAFSGWTRPGRSRLVVANADGTCPLPLTNVRRSEADVAWQPVVGPPSATYRCADIELYARPPEKPVPARSRFSFRIHVGNVGNERGTGVRVVARVPRPLSVVSASVGRGGRCRLEPHIATCVFSALDVDAQSVITIHARAPRAGRFTIAVSGRAVQRDTDRLNNSYDLVQDVSRCTHLGGTGNETVRGTPRPDVICPGFGRDRVLAGAGPDLVLAGDGARDAIACGPGRDRVVADRGDFVARDCERVARR